MSEWTKVLNATIGEYAEGLADERLHQQCMLAALFDQSERPKEMLKPLKKMPEPPKPKELTLSQAMKYALERTLKRTSTDYESVTVHFTDGSSISWVSEHDWPPCDDTPGDGIQAPTIWLHVPVKKRKK